VIKIGPEIYTRGEGGRGRYIDTYVSAIYTLLFIIAICCGFPAAHALTFATRNQVLQEKPESQLEYEYVQN